MTDQPLSNETSLDQALAMVIQNQERLMQALEGQFNEVWQALLCLPDDHPRKEAALNAIQQAWYANGALVELMQQHAGAGATIAAAATEVREQRDQIAGELANLVEALRNHWQTNHPLVAPLYQEIADAHNAAFWESLPYDMAAVLGGQWDFIQADLLYSILTVDPEEIAEDGSDFGFTPEQLLTFRNNLLVMLRAFMAGIEARHGG